MSDHSDDEENTQAINLFQEPDDFYLPEKQPTFVQHSALDGTVLDLRLVGHNPLWGHLLWQAGRTIARYLEEHSSDLSLSSAHVLELGAGAGLPSIICALHHAPRVLVTDYPDAELIENLTYNIARNSHLLPQPVRIAAQGHLWGAAASLGEFDLLILADLLFNHSEHGKLLATVRRTLKRDCASQALVFFTPYRPWLLAKDLAFLDLARGAGLGVEQIFEKVMDEVMFKEDRGDELLRRTVFGYSLRWTEEELAKPADGEYRETTESTGT
nr:protein n-methyltransferase nnt1 [Quercus suber]